MMKHSRSYNPNIQVHQHQVQSICQMKSNYNIEVTEQQVRKKINSIQHGSGAGIDGFRPQILKDVISGEAGIIDG